MKHIAGIDHLGWLVNDLDAVAASFARLGFTLSPRQTHSPSMGRPITPSSSATPMPS
jgi:hypothetical protein